MGHRYRIIDRIASGGTAAVWRAEDAATGQVVAIKRLHSDRAADPDARARLDYEAEVGTTLVHPAIVAVLDRGEDGSVPYLVMEHVAGETLGDLLHRVGALPWERAADVARQIAAALDHAHRHGVLHRDIKPSNVLIEEETGRVVVADFGTASPARADTRTTREGVVIGTVEYMAPERAMGAPGSAASDVYSLGVLLYEMVTGHVPFTGDSPLAVAMAHQLDEPAAPGRLASIPAALERVVLTAMAKAPRERYPTAAAFLSALEAALSPAIVAPTTTLSATTRRHRLVASGRRLAHHPVAAATAASLALGSASTWVLLSLAG